MIKKFNNIVYYNLENYFFLKNAVTFYVIYILIKKISLTFFKLS
jgi:hypothetical protein